MTITITKPILPNSSGYLGPSGITKLKQDGNFAQSHGYGHEEWNHRSDLSVELNGQRYKAFYLQSEDIYKKMDEGDLDWNDRFDIYMTNRQDSPQFIHARAIDSEYLSGEKKSLVRQQLSSFLEQAKDDTWGVRVVREAFDNNQAEFEQHWSFHMGESGPNWLCPIDKYEIFSTPIAIDVKKTLPDRDKFLVNYYNRYSELTENDVDALEAYIEQFQYSVNTILDGSEEPAPTTNPNSATSMAVVAVRKGQNIFRTRVLDNWDRSCAVTGVAIEAVLRASHIVPWRHSNHEEKYDPHNGLPLCASLDALFDRGLISFASTGEMLVADEITLNDRAILRIPQKLRHKPTKEMSHYLKKHRVASGLSTK